MKKVWIAIIITVTLVTVAVMFYISGGKKKGIEVKTAAVGKGNIVAYFSTSGSLDSKTKRSYYVSTPAKVVKLYKSVGDSVKSGDIICELEVSDMSVQLQTAQKQYENAKLQLDALQKEKDNANANQNKVQSSIQGSASGQSMPGQSTSGQSASSGNDIDTQIKIQENQVEIARLNVQSIQQNINKQQKYIKSDINGTVTAESISEGNMALSQSPAVTVEDISSLEVVLNVNQYDITKIAAGDAATIKFNDKSYSGKVSSVDPAATKTVSASGTDTTVKAAVDVTGNDGSLKSGYDVDIDVKTGEKDNVVKIPAEAIVTDKNDKEKVFVVKDGVAREADITTGLSSDIEYEVTKGLSAGDTVILNPSASIKDGTRVYQKGVSK